MENIFTAARPFLILMKVFGLFPLPTVSHAVKGDFKLRLQDLVFTLFGFCLISSVIVVNIYRDRVEYTSSKILPIAWETTLMFELLSLAVFFFYQHSKRKRIAEFLHLINDFDKKVEFALGLPI